MIPNGPEWKRIHRLFQRGVTLVEYVGLLVIGFATTFRDGRGNRRHDPAPRGSRWPISC